MFGHKKHLTLARKRMAEMDKALTALQRMARKCPARPEGKKLISEMKKRRAQLLATSREMKTHISRAELRMKKLSAAGTFSWSAFRTALTKSHRAFAKANHKAGKAVRRAIG